MRLWIATSADKNQTVIELAKERFEEKHQGVSVWAFLQELAGPHTESGREWAKHNLAVTRTVALSSGQLTNPLFAPFLEAMHDARLGAFDVSSLRLWNLFNNDIFQDWIIRGGRLNLEEHLKRIARDYDENV